MSSPSVRRFPLGAVLSVVTGRLVSENHMAGIYEVLGWMTGESIFTHQIPRVSREAAPVILRLHPDLAEAVVDAEHVSTENWQDWLGIWKARYGDLLDVPTFASGEHERIDPLSELVEKVHPDRIAIVALGQKR